MPDTRFPSAARQRIHEVIFEADTPAGKLFDLILFAAICGSVIVVLLESMASMRAQYGPLLRAGMTPEAIVRALLDSDPDPGYRGQPWPKAGRQFAVMDAKGSYAVHTGVEASAWAGHKTGKYCTAQGNILAGEAVVNDMVAAFEQTEGHLSQRLMAALDAGQAAGGDTRGMQSAAMLIVKKNGGVWLNNDVVLRLQVDEASDGDPLKELRRLVDYWHRRQRPRR